MNKFKRVERIIEGKIIEIEIGHNTLQYVLTKRLTVPAQQPATLPNEHQID